jgi:hypothetical protein
MRYGALSAAACAALIVFAPGGSAQPQAEYKAGVARLDITPKKPVWMSGYGDRTKPGDGMVHPLWAKALAVEDRKGNRAVLVSVELIGLPRQISELVAARVEKEYLVPRTALVLNSTHTHTGPYVRHNLITMFDLPEAEIAAIREYSAALTENLVTVIGAALGKLEPARIEYGQGTGTFAMNRRQKTSDGVIIGVNPQGPMDHTVPVLRVTAANGAPLAILFGYACHNTTLTGSFYQWSGDYAGFAQIELEKANPGAMAMFFMLAGADQNPEPRGTLPMAEQHGKTLAAEVSRVLRLPMKPVRGTLRSALQITALPFQPHTRQTFEEELSTARSAARRARARYHLSLYDQRQQVTQVPYPVQALRFGDSLTLLTMGGEVVVDYALQVKRRYAGDIVVMGYTNDVMCYIPTAQILREGGYEAVDSMVGYGQPAPFTEEVEERVLATIDSVLRRVGVKRR